MGTSHKVDEADDDRFFPKSHAELERRIAELEASLLDAFHRIEDLAAEKELLTFRAGTQEAENAALREQVARMPVWISVDERLPDVPRNDYKQFIIACRRKRSGKVYVFAAEYLNQMRLLVEWPDDSQYDDIDDGCVPVTGWYTQTKNDPDYDTSYEEVCGDGDEVLAWASMPIYINPQLASGPATYNDRENDMNIYAYTEFDYAPEYYPGFVSINRDDNGKIYISVRSRGADIPSKVEIPEADARAMGEALALVAAVKTLRIKLANISAPSRGEGV
jgi:hypothetical protein